jgi:hypothetical protein
VPFKQKTEAKPAVTRMLEAFELGRMHTDHDVNAGVRTPEVAEESRSLTAEEAKVYSSLQYHTLDLKQHEIRLIEIVPNLSPVSGRIQCRIWHAKPGCDYKALSYTWGPSELYRMININRRGFAVRENLWHFLNATRLRRLKCSLWIDAVSIDQDNVTERNHQVQYMGHIYSQASQVIIWLGLATEGTNALVRHLLRSQQQRFLEAHCETRHLHEIHVSHALIDAGAQDLYQRDYWLRTWVIQEILLAKELVVFIGAETIAWRYVSAFLLFGESRMASKLEHVIPSSDSADVLRTTHAYRIFQQRVVFQGTMHSHPLISLLRQFAHSQCRDTRDRVFGLLGLAEQGEDFPVDYNMAKSDLFTYTLNFCGGAAELATARKLARILELTAHELDAQDMPDYQNIITSVTRFVTGIRITIFCYHCNQNIILPDDEELPLRPYYSAVMCCLRDADMDEHLFFPGSSEQYYMQLESVGLPAHHMTQDAQLQAMKTLFSYCSLSSLSSNPKSAYLRVSKKHYVYLLSDTRSRAMLLHGRTPLLRHKVDVLEKLQRVDRQRVTQMDGSEHSEGEQSD